MDGSHSRVINNFKYEVVCMESYTDHDEELNTTRS